MSKSSKKNVPKKNSSVRPYTVMCTDLYLLWILLVYPLYYADGYFHLPERKATFWCTSTLIYIGVTLLGVIITYVSTRDEWSLERIKKNISMTDVFMFGFLISNLIAFALSEDKTNAWTGAGARYYGAKVLILVCISYFLISRYAWVNKVFIWAFLIGGNGVCLLATFDYFGMDVLGINQQMQVADQMVFISTMGNANTCASYVTMALAGAMAYFCIVKTSKESIFVAISVLICSGALITARSDSAFVGIMLVLILMLILVFLKKIELKKYIQMLTLVVAGLYIFFVFRKKFETSLLSRFYDKGLPNLLNNLTLLGIILLLMIVACLLVWVCERKRVKLTKRSITILVICVLSIGIIILIYFCVQFKVVDLIKDGLGIVSEEELPEAARIQIYQRTLGAYVQLPLLHKIFGCGQASISSILNQYYGQELRNAGIIINSAHNHILDYLISIGLVGAVCYLGCIATFVKKFFVIIKRTPSMLFLGCIVCAYFGQGFFNIEQTNTTPIFWLMLALGEAVYRQNKLKKDTN